MWVTKLLISPVKIRIFCPKKSKFGPKMAFLFILGQALPAHLVPCWLVVVARGLYLARHLFTLCYLLIYSNINVTCKNIIVKQPNIQIHDRAVLLNCVFSLGDTNNLNWLDIDMFSLLVLLQRPP